MSPAELATILARPGYKLSRDNTGGPVPSNRGVEVKHPADFIARLMSCPSWRGTLLPEAELSAWVAAELRVLTRAGKLRCVWSMHPAEARRGGKAGQMWQALLVYLGVIPGSSDFVFTWGDGSGWIELKIERQQTDLLSLRKDGTARAPRRTYMRPGQVDFAAWCAMHAVRHAVCRNIREVTDTLKQWGVLS